MDEDVVLNKERGVLGEFFEKKISDNKYLITTRHGSWVVLNSIEFEQLKNNDFYDNKKLFFLLEKKGVLLTEKSVPLVIQDLSLNYAFLDIPNILCIISVTNSCTLKCDYCHACATPVSENMDVMSEKTMFEVIDFLCKLPHKSLSIEFQGGEPLICFDLIKKFLNVLESRLKECNKILYSKVIVSNMTLMDEKKAEYLIKENIGLCSSLDGPKELHDLQRKPVTDVLSYDSVVLWHDYFKKQNMNLNLLPTITKNSVKFGAKAIIDEYVYLNQTHVNFRLMHKIGRGKNPDLWVDVDDFFNFWVEGMDYLFELNLNGVVIYDYFAQSLLKNILLPVRPYMCMRRPCGAGISQIAFNSDGTILPCDLARSINALGCGNVKNMNYVDVRLKILDVTTRITETIPLCDSCIFGAYCGDCVCHTYSDSKTIVPKTTQNLDCKLNKKVFTYLFEKLSDEKYRSIFEKWVTMK